MQHEIIKKIREIGRVFNPDMIGMMIKLYTPLLAESPREGVKVTRGIPYGPHERQKLDVYKADH